MIKRYIRTFVLIVTSCLIGTCLINLVVNPWRITPSPLSSDKFEPYRDLGAQIRTGKCGFVRTAPEIGIAFIGSSRVANSLDPLNPYWKRDDVYNLGSNACYIYESTAVFHHLIKKQSPELIIFGLDPGDLSSDFDSRIVFDFDGSPLGPEKGRIDREIRYLVGISTLEASLETIKRRISDEAPQYDDRGLRRHRSKRVADQRKFLAWALAGSAQFEGTDAARENSSLRPDKLALLDEVISTCHQRDIRLILLIHPQHALSHTHANDEPILPFERERREITELADLINREIPAAAATEVWDFGDFHPINCEPLPSEGERMANWNDLEHYTLPVGDLILARMMGWPINKDEGDDYGMKLTPENFSEWVSRAKRGCKEYTKGAGKDDIAWAQELTAGDDSD